MFDEESRYADVSEASRTEPDGREVRYKRRRLIGGRDAVTLTRVDMEASDRLDHAAAETLGDPRQYWRICDASGVMNPRRVDESEDVTLVVPVAGTEQR